MKIGCISYHIHNLKRRRFLPGDPIGIDRIHDCKIVAFADLAHDSKRVVKVAINSNDFCTVSKSLQQFAARNFPRRQDHYAPNSGAGGIGRRRSRSISR